MEKEIVLKIEGMHCPMCEKHVTNALSKTEGVKKAAVSLKEGSAKVVFDDAVTDVSKISAAVEEAGYHAVEQSRQEKI